LNFFRTPFLLPLLYPNLTWRVPTDDKVLYLTFDDGPVPGPTEFVLKQLRDHDARATFFCIGDNVRKHPTVFDQVLGQGHAIGNHTFNHLKGWRTSRQRYLENVAQCQRQMELGQALPARFFRPPYGRITRTQIKALTDQYQIVMWDVLTHDYARSVSPEQCLRGSIDAARPGSIVVFHDSLKAERNLTYVLPKFLAHFSAQGFVFRTLPA